MRHVPTSSLLRLVVAAALAVAVVASSAAGGLAQEAKPSATAKTGSSTKMQLSISKDGRAIVDQNGKIIARFTTPGRVKPAASSTTAKLPGHMVCEPDCVIYDGTRCVKWIRTCTWVFDD